MAGIYPLANATITIETPGGEVFSGKAIDFTLTGEAGINTLLESVEGLPKLSRWEPITFDLTATLTGVEIELYTEAYKRIRKAVTAPAGEWTCPYCGMTRKAGETTCYGGCGAPRPLFAK